MGLSFNTKTAHVQTWQKKENLYGSVISSFNYLLKTLIILKDYSLVSHILWLYRLKNGKHKVTCLEILFEPFVLPWTLVHDVGFES